MSGQTKRVFWQRAVASCVDQNLPPIFSLSEGLYQNLDNFTRMTSRLDSPVSKTTNYLLVRTTGAAR